jgi:outer membrane protein
MKNKITTETSNSWSTYQSSKSVLQATKAQLKAAEIANEGITLEYDSGNTRTTLEVIQSRSLLLDARISFARSERDFIISQFKLAKKIGLLSLKSFK